MKTKLKNLLLILIYLVRHPKRFYNALSSRGEKSSALRNSDNFVGGREKLSFGKDLRRVAKWCWATLPRRIVSTLVIAALLITPISLIFLTKKAQAAWWNDSWQYRQKIQLSNSTGADLTDFQVSTIVDTASLITDGKMQATTCADMRFTDSKGQPLDYWIEGGDSGCGSSTTIVWIKVSRVYSGTSATSLYIYYGNPSASAVQDGNKVFQLFDDFKTVDTNKWHDTTGTNNIISDGYDSSALQTSGDDNDIRYYSSVAFSDGYAVKARMKEDGTDGGIFFDAQDASNGYLVTSRKAGGTTAFQWYKRVSGGWSALSSHNSVSAWTSTEYRTLEISRVGNAISVADNQSPITYGTSTDSTYSSGSVGIRANAQQTIDWIFVRKAVSSNPTTSASAEEIGPGPVAYWKFDDPASTPPGGTAGQAAKDSTVNGNDGVLGSTVNADSADPTWKPESDCVSGKCLYYDGVDDSISVGDNSLLEGMENMTISAWIKPKENSGQDNVIIVDKGNTTAYRFHIFDSNQTDGTGNLTAWINGINASPTPNIELSMRGDTWYHVALVYDNANNQAKFYVNGVLKGTTSVVSGAIGTNSTAFRIGNNGAQRMKGFLDEPKIYPYARSADQIQQDYNSGLAGSSTSTGSRTSIGESPKWMTDGLVGQWKMDEASGTTVADASGNGNTGTLTGAQETGTAQTGSSTTVIVDGANAALSSTDSAYNNMILQITSGALNGTQRTITGYTGATKTFTFAALASDPTGATYIILHQTGGKFGNGMGFGGNNDIVNVVNSASLKIGTQDYSVGTWFKTSAAKDQEIIRQSGSWLNGYWISMRSTGKIWAKLGKSDGSISTGDSTQSYNDGNWHHAVLVLDRDSKMSVYVDGNSVVSTSISAYNGVYINQDYALGIGGMSGSFQGQLDDTRVYTRALSPDEVRQLSEYGPDPVGWWKMDEGSGETAYDFSGYGNNGSWSRTGSHYVNGKYGNAGKLTNGGGYTGDYVNAGHASTAEIGKGDFTISTWAKLSPTQGTYAGLVTKGAGSAADEGYTLTCAVSGSTCDLMFWVSDGASRCHQSAHDTLALDDQWHHIEVVAKRDSRAYFYVDGKDMGYDASIPFTTFFNEDISNSSGNLLFGSWVSSWITNGLIDDVRIYNYARTPKQVVEDMNAGHPIGGSPVGSKQMHLKYDEGNGTVIQDWGTGNDDGDLFDGPTWASDGKFGKAVTLDGLNDRVQGFASDPTEYTGGDMTISTWFKPDASDSDDGRIISKPWNSSGQYNYMLWLKSDNKIGVSLQAANLGTILFNSNATISDGAWHHLALELKGDTKLAQLFIDGKLDTSYTHSITNWVPSAGDQNKSLTFGCLYPYDTSWAGSASWCVKGSIDETKIYAAALSDEQIKMDMNQGKELQLGGQSSTTGATGQAAEYCVPGDVTSCAGPVGEWKFDEKTGTAANDTSGNGNNGTFYSDPGASTWARGKLGSALNFGGASYKGMYIADSSLWDFAGKSVTVEFWEKANTTQSSSPSILHHMTGGATPVGWHCQISASNGTVGCYHQGSSGISVATTSDLRDNLWHHIVWTIDNSAGTSKIYVDGRENNIDNSFSGLSDFDKVLEVGGRNVTGYNFNGLLDQVQIFQYARSAAQIAWDYNRGKPVGWWKMDEGEGGSAYDSSGSGNTGTLTSMDPPNDWVDGKFGKALDFDGSNDYVSVGNTGKSVNAVSLWVKPNSTSQNIIDLDGGTHTITVSGGTISASNFSTVYVDGQESSTLPDTNWHMITAIANTAFNASSLSIGKVSTNYFQGQLDDVRIYNYPLTAEQIKQTMNNGAAIRFGE